MESDIIIRCSSVIDVEVEEGLDESASGETSLPVVDISKVILVEVSIEHHIFEEGGTAAKGNHNLAGKGLSDEGRVEVGELASHIKEAVGIAKLEGCGHLASEAGGLVNEQIVEVAVIDKGIDVSLEVVIEVDGLDHGVEALAESVAVVLESSDGTKEEGLP